MAITAGELRVLLVAKDQMTKVLDKAQGSMKKTGKIGLKMAKALKVIGGAAALGVGAVVGLGGAMVKLAKDAAPIAAVRGAFQGIADDAPAMLRALQQGSMGMVAQGDLMKSYNSAAQLVSKTFADQLPGAMGYLSKVAGATGEDMGFMIDSLVKGVGRMSPMILDNLGLQVTLADAVARAAEMFGVEADELTKAQQQAGMMDIVMQQLATNTAAMPEVLGSLNQQLASLPVMFADAKQMAGEALMPALSAIAEVGLPLVRDALGKLQPKLETFGKWLAEKIPAAIEEARSVFAKLKAAFDIVKGVVETLFEAFKFEGMTVSWRYFLDNLGLTGSVVSAIIPVFEKVTAALSTLGVWLRDTIPIALEWLRSTWETVWPVLQQAVGLWWEGVKIYFNLVIDYWTLIWNGLQTLWSRFQEAWPAIKQVILDAWAAIQPKLQELKRWFTDELIPKLQELRATFEREWTKIQMRVMLAWENHIKPALEKLKTWFSEELPNVLVRLKRQFAEKWSSIKLSILIAWVKIKPKLEKLKAWFVDELIPAVKELWDKFKEAWPGIKKAVADAWANVRLKFVALKTWIVITLIPKLTELWDKAKEVWAGIEKAVADAWEGFSPHLETLKIVLGTFTTDVLPALKLAWDTIVEALAPVIESFKNEGTESDDLMKKIGDFMGSAAVTGLSELFLAIADAANSVTKGINDMKAAIEAAKGIIDGIRTKLKNLNSQFGETKPPWWLTPGSPTPFEEGLAGIRDVLPQVTKFLGDMGKAIPDHEKFSKLAASFNTLFSGVSGTIKAGAGIIGGIAEFKEKFAKLGMGLSEIKAIVTATIIPVVKAIQDAFAKGLEILGEDDDDKDTVAGSLQIWGRRMSAISSILSAVNSAVKTLSTKSEAFKTGAAKGLEAIRDAVARNVIPVVRGIHAAFKNLPILDEDEVIAASLAIWAKRYQAIATILDAVDKAVNMLEGKSDSFKTGAAKGLEAIRDAITQNVIPVIRGIHAAFKSLPLLDKDELISASLAIWAKRYQGISSILNAVNSAVEMLSNKSDKFKAGAAKGLEAIRDAITKNVIPVIRGIHAAFKNLPLLDSDEVISKSLAIWAKRYQGIASILGAVNTAVEMLSNKSEVFKTGAVKGLEAIRDAVTKHVIPVVRGIHAAFKNLPLLDEKEVISESLKIWAARYQGISGILNSVNAAVEMLSNKSDKFKTGAAKGLIAIRDAVLKNVIPVVRGIHAAFKKLPLLDTDELISKSLKIWADRYSAISSILGSVNSAVEMLINKSDRFKSAAAKGLIAIRDAILKNVIPVVRGIHAAFKELPLLDTDEVIAASLKIWGERFGAISSILDGVNSAVDMLVNKSDKFKTAAAKGLIAIRDAVTAHVIPVIRGIHAALKNLPILDEEEVISASLKIWAERLSAGVGIVTDTMAIAAAVLDTYVSPDLSKITLIATDAVNVIDKVEQAIQAFWTNADDMIARSKKIADVKAMVGDVVTTIRDTIEVAKGLSEMSWREVKKHQVDSFTLNLANIVKWLTDPESGISAIAGLSNMGVYKTAAANLGGIVTEVVDAVRKVMTLPAIWDDRLNIVSSGLALFLKTIAASIQGVAANIGRGILDGFAAVLNDGAWSQLGARNATAYEAGWKAALGIASPSKVGMEIGRNFREGVEEGGGNTDNNYNLYVTTTQPAVDLVQNFRMLEALG